MLSNLTTFLSNGHNLMFFFFALLTVGSAVFMISLTKIVHMVIAVAFSFLSMAGLFVLLDAEFIAFVQVLIYAGAMSILMLFGIMMTKHEQNNQTSKRSFHSALAFIGAAIFFGIIYITIGRTVFPRQGQNLPENSTAVIGEQIFTLHVIPFELVSLLLTVAFIGAIIIAKREED